MCGIVGITAKRNIAPYLVDGLQALEYRGYDSAGLALLVNGHVERLRTKGKVRELGILQADSGLDAHCGIAHTRWATHGVPSEVNAHPHVSGLVTVVHNGIIENHEALRRELSAQGFEFESQTDTEVIAHLLEREQQRGLSLLQSVQQVVAGFHGAYAIVAMSAREPGVLVGARFGSPLVLGYGQNENYFASDVHALLPLTRDFSYLEEGDVAQISTGTVQIFDAHGTEVVRAIKQSTFSRDAASRGDFAHYMLKEIYEQSRSVADTLEGRIAGGKILTQIFGIHAAQLLHDTDAVHIIACGTSYHAGLVARYWIEQLAGIPCTAEIASEYRYRDPVVRAGTLFLTISQSGETADTLAALKLAKQRPYLAHMAVCNVPESSIVRESGLILMTRAGPEIGVASTKAFTTQLVALALFHLSWRVRKAWMKRVIWMACNNWSICPY
jgi:glucosamine--fructose-6-phosphate aminotransferase (isomerizing)